MGFKEEYELWINSAATDEETKNELKNISADEKEIEERFYKNLEFGTAGLRGILGAGINRMNIYTVRKATQGLADYISALGDDAKRKGVAISYDSRHFSETFAGETAAVLAANGIRAYLSNRLRPVPELSFAVRHFNCVAGVMVTASHNPPEYNGYKVYGADGSQMSPEAADKVAKIMDNMNIFDDIKLMDFNEAVNTGLIQTFGDEFDDIYLSHVLDQRLNPEAAQVVGDNFKIIYTPIHGSGNIPVRRALDMAGYKNVIVIKEQEQPDGSFPTVKSPNPEYKEAFEIAIEKAKEENADFIIGTDPDCDRVGVVVRNNEGEYIALTGNMVGALLTDYVLGSMKTDGTLPDNGVVIKTIVTSYMPDIICKHFGVEVINTLTGFKFIGEKIKEFEDNGNYKTFLLGFEESYGYLKGTYARDKDGVVASMLIAEMAAWYRIKGMSLYEGLCELYKKYGTFRENLVSVTYEGMAGAEKIKNIMAAIRKNPPKETAGLKVKYFNDYSCSLKADLITGATYEITLPKSNVLLFELENDCWWAARPSGTEPKIKFYFGAKGETADVADHRLEAIKAAVTELTESIN